MKQIKGIYLIERIGGDFETDKRKFYVGMAVDIFDRWQQHCSNSEQYIDKVIQKYGIENFSFRIIDTVSNQKDLKTKESMWIETYKAQYDENTLYNISETTNVNPLKISTAIKTQIRNLFKTDIKQSIYAISEAYNIPWKEVIKIRKPILKEKGLKYNSKIKEIVSIETNQVPDNWQGGRLTENLGKTILSLLAKNEDVDKDIVSKGDLANFLNDIKDNIEYVYAESLKTNC